MPEPDVPWLSPDGTRLGYKIWKPEGCPLATVLAIHGLGCRAEDFAPLGETLRKKEIQLVAWNLRGQGLDPVAKRRGAWLDTDGVIADLESLKAWVADETIPLFLCGESMGALLALQIAIRKPWSERLAGVMLFSPVVDLAQKNPPWMKPMLRALSVVAPGLRLKPGWFVHGSGSMPKLTRIPERQQYLATAPHRLGPLTFGFLANMADLIESASQSAGRLEIPVAVFSAGQDVFVTTEQTRDFFARIRSADKTHFHYPEAYHQLMFDLDAAQVLSDATGWLLSHTST